MNDNTKGRNYTAKLTTTALMVALAMILAQIKLFSMPQDKRTEDYITGRFG